MYETTDVLIKKISQASLKFLAPLTPEETFKTIVSEVLKIAKGNEAVIILPENDALQTVYASSPHVTIVTPRKKGYAYRSLKSGKSFLVHKDAFGSIHPELTKIKSSLFIPLRYQEERIGVLSVRYYNKTILPTSTLEVLQLFGSLASMSIHKMQLYHEVQQALQTRDLFLALASHELKTPLTTITVYGEMMYRYRMEGKLIEEKWTKNLYQEIIRLNALVNELLHVSSMQKGQLTYQFGQVHLGQLIERALASFELTNPLYKVLLTNHIEGKDLVDCDVDKIIQVLLNVLTNAAKFSDPASSISMDLYRNHTAFIIRIEDQGIGIPKAEIPKLFDRFYKVSSNKKDGMGLGLYLTKTIIEKHKGSITIDSQLHKGTTVEIRLPVYDI